MAKSSKPIARVVGGGFVGWACALELQADGFQVELFDASADQEAASYGNAGHLATEQLAPMASWRTIKRLPHLLYSRGGPASFSLSQIGHWLPFGLRLLAASRPSRFERGLACNRVLLGRAIPAWRDMLQRVGQPNLLSSTGHRVVWESQLSAAKGMQSWLSADLGSTTACALDKPSIQMISKQFAGKPVAGLQFTGTGHIRDLQLARTAMRETFAADGGIWHKQTVDQIRKTSGGSQLVVKDAAQARLVGEAQDLIVVCAGIGSGDLLREHFGQLPMIAERGYHLQLENTSLANLNLDSPVVFEDRSVIVTPFAHGLRLASFTEFSSAKARSDLGKWLRLKQHARDLGIDAEEGSPTTWIGSRPTLPDYMPAIGRSHSADNLILACAHHHLGLTLAAVTGQLVRLLARRQSLAVDISALAPQRYIQHF